MNVGTRINVIRELCAFEGRFAGTDSERRAANWLAREQNDDGGFNFAGRGGPSGIDDTSAPVQSLASAGRRGSADGGRRGDIGVIDQAARRADVGSLL